MRYLAEVTGLNGLYFNIKSVMSLLELLLKSALLLSTHLKCTIIF